MTAVFREDSPSKTAMTDPPASSAGCERRRGRSDNQTGPGSGNIIISLDIQKGPILRHARMVGSECRGGPKHAYSVGVVGGETLPDVNPEKKRDGDRNEVNNHPIKPS